MTAAVRFLRARRGRRDPPSVSWRWRWFWGALGLSLLGDRRSVAADVRNDRALRARLRLVLPDPGDRWAAGGCWRFPARRAGRVAIRAAYVGLAALTLVIGVLFGFTGYFGHFARHNPALLHTLEHALSVCGR